MTTNKIESKKGFTLVELLVSLSIMAVLAGVAAMSLMAYHDYSTFKRQNEYAQSLFVAAQNALTRYSENGELEEMGKRLEKYGETLQGGWLSGAAAEDFQAGGYEGRIYTITVNRDGSQGGGPLLRDIFDRILEPYVYDKSILDNACVTLEFDPVGGVVYSVLYSDVKDGFVYGPDTDTHVSVSSREESERRDRMVGYYGIKDLSDETSRTKEKPAIDTVRLVNGDTLSLQFRLSDKYAAKATADLDYDLEVCNADSRRLLMTLTLKDIPSVVDKKGNPLRYDGLVQKAAVTVYGSDGAPVGEAKEYPFVAYVDQDYTVTLFLDCVDLAAGAGAAADTLGDTYSFRRFGLEEDRDAGDTRNLYVNVRAHGGRYKTSAWKRSNAENAYFAWEEVQANPTVLTERYGVANARHLYNVRFEEAREPVQKTVFTYRVEKSFAWGGASGIFKGAYGSQVFTNGAETAESVDGVATAFPSIAALRRDHTFTSASSKHVISGLVLRGGTGLGLFEKNSGSISYVTLENAVVAGGSSVGAFCGVNAGAVTGLTTVGGSVTGNTDVGGIVGKDDTSGTNKAYRDLHNGSRVTGSRYVGGILGRLASPANGSAAVEDCTNTGLVLASLGQDTDLTGEIHDKIIGGIDQESQIIEENGKSARISISASLAYATEGSSAWQKEGYKHNMYRIFRELNGGGYPTLNGYDMAVLTELQEAGVLELGGYSGTFEERAAAYCGDTVWLPCALKDDDGTFVAAYDGSPATQRYSVVLVAKPKNKNNIESFQNTALVYHAGTYYLSLNNKKFANVTVLNREQAFDTLGDSSVWTAYVPNVHSGQVTPVAGATTFEDEPSHLGGIVGFADGSLGDSFIIRNCTSSPESDGEKLRELLAEDAAYEADHESGSQPILGVYVGGIAGFAHRAEISGCSTGGGTVVGSHYVGGIVGFGTSAVIGEEQSNAADVIGKYYVGGVVGANSLAGEEDPNGFVTVTTEYCADSSGTGTVSKWMNRGVVLAVKEYGGGITGYNAGRIADCGSDVEASEAMTELAETYGGDYLGGLVGYNCAELSAQTSTGVNSYVAGGDYLGGVVGYNDEVTTGQTRVYGYRYTGGTVTGRDFVGGFAGLNISRSLFYNNFGKVVQLDAAPNLVKGRYAVGGVIGGNLVASEKDVFADLVTNNFLGRIEAQAFAGGFIGVQMMAKDGDTARKTAEKLRESSDSTAAAVAIFDNVSGSSGVRFTILGNGRVTTSYFGDITAQVYVGGVLGYNVKDTVTELYNIESKSPVTATGAVDSAELTGEAGRDPYDGDMAKVYSYAGSIAGKCTKKMIIGECSAADTGRVTAAGTYTGGLVEVNEGLVRNCQAGSLGRRGQNYVGGVVGLNKKDGVVSGPSLNGKTVIGSHMVGGLVCDNYGTVTGGQDSEASGRKPVTGTVYGYGENIGGLVGFSHKGAKVTNFTLSLNLLGSGSNVGGGIGTNEGEMSGISYGSGQAGEPCQVQGDTNVGGVVGRYDSERTLSLVTNYARVTANYGSAGGIAGAVDSAAKISFCNNYGAVSVLGEKAGAATAAGGITGVCGTAATIAECRNLGAVEALKGAAGGIVGSNGGLLSKCSMSGGDGITGLSQIKITVTGGSHAGGIAGKNTGNIENSTVNGVGIASPADLSGNLLGGVAGENLGMIRNFRVGTVQVTAHSTGVSAGGVAGLNAAGAELAGSGTDGEVANVKLGFVQKSLNYFGYLGGAAGVNRGTVSGCRLDSVTVEGTANDPAAPPSYNPNYDYEPDGAVVYGYGGLTGLNESAAGSAGTVSGCTLSRVVVTVIGDPYNIANAGGAAGVNGKNARISGITLEPASTDADACAVTSASYAHIGGMVGCNYGLVEKTGTARAEGFGDGSTAESEAARRASADTSSMLAVTAGMGHVGGVVGYNRSTGRLEDCATGARWTVLAKNQGQDNGAGGIVGYNASSQKIVRCDNYGTVAKSSGNSVGGIVGRNEVTTGNWYYEDCNNFGDLTGVRVGGVMGCLKYNGGTLYNCSNYGAVSGGAGDNNGGILGMVYSNTRDAVLNISSCKNFGSLKEAKGESLGGIVGSISNGCRYLTTVVTDCVNTGVINSGVTYSAGIIGRSDGEFAATGYQGTTVLRGCRNYGLPSGDGNFMGTIAQIAKPAGSVIEGCFGAAGAASDSNLVNYPIRAATNVANQGNRWFTDCADGSITEKDYGIGTALYLRSDGSGGYSATAAGADVPALTGLTFGGSAFDEFVHDRDDDLAVLPGGANNLRQQTYLEIDESLILDSKEVSVPYGLACVDQGGSAVLTWKCDKGYRYEVEVTLKDGTVQEYTAFDKRFELSTVGLEGQTLTFRVRAVSYAGDVKSEYSEPFTYKVPEKTLPVPQVRFYLGSLTGGSADHNKYRAVVVNAGDYADCGTVQVTLDARLTREGSKALFEETIVLKDGVQQGTVLVPSGSGNKNYMVTAQAVHQDGTGGADTGYGKSPMTTRESMLPGAGSYTNDRMADVTLTAVKGLGFNGDTPETLSFRVAMKYQNDYSTYYRSEFLATDTEGLGVPVAYSSSVLNVPMSASGYTFTTISGLPLDLMAKREDGQPKYTDISVRSYPISMANEICFTGFDVGAGYTAAQLEDLYVTRDGGIAAEGDADAQKLIGTVDGKKSLAPGYLLFCTGEDSYTLSFNMLVREYSADRPSQTTLFTGLTDGKTAYDPPDITFTYDKEAETYFAVWDSAEENGRYTPLDATANYRYTLTGLTKSGASVEIESGERLASSGQDSLVLQGDASLWNYVNVTLRVDRVGQTDGNGVTQKFGSTNSVTVKTRLKLSTVPAPVAILWEKDSLVYLVDWNGISDPEEERALSSYDLTVKTTITGADGQKHEVTAVYNTRNTDPTCQIDLNDVTGTDGEGNTWNGSTVPETLVTLSVTAVADPGQEEYGDSLPGVEYGFTMPKRLEVPEAGRLTVSPACGKTGPLTVEEFGVQGFTLAFDGSGSPDGESGGKYQLAVAVLDESGVTVRELSTKGSPFVMEGTRLSDRAVYRLAKKDGFTADDSGLRLSISIRAVSDQNISSLWSEAEAFELPRVKVDPVAMAEVLGKQELHGAVYDSTGADTGVTQAVRQDALSWTQAEYAGGYTVSLTRKDLPAGADQSLKLADSLELSYRTEDGSPVPVLTFTDAVGTVEDDGSVTPAAPKQIAPQKEIAGNIVNYTFVWKRRQVDLVDSSGVPTGYRLELAGKLTVALTLDGEGGTAKTEYELVLPDAVVPKIEEISSMSKEEIFYKAVSLTAAAELPARYDGSDRADASRDADGVLRPVSPVTGRIVTARPKPTAPPEAQWPGTPETPKPTSRPSPSPAPSVSPSATPAPTPSLDPEPTESPELPPSEPPEATEPPSQAPEESSPETPAGSPEPEVESG